MIVPCIVFAMAEDSMREARVVKDHGVQGIAGAFLIAVVVPIVLAAVIAGRKKVRARAVPVSVGGEEGFAMRNSRYPEMLRYPWEGATTVAALFELACEKHAERRFLGWRDVIARVVIETKDGRKFEKQHLSEYKWQTYSHVFARANNFAAGLVKMGHKLDSRAAIFSDTRAEWFIAAQACFRQNIVVVTIYASLGEDALVYSLNETEVTTLICDSKQLKRLPSIASQLSSVKYVVYFDDAPVEAELLDQMKQWEVLSFSRVEKLGELSECAPRLPSSDDVAVIMYTSGSTGNPKGVMITHGNMVATVAGVSKVIPKIGPADRYLAFLPLAHVFELAAEIVVSSVGGIIGYGSALTLIDTSNKIKTGTKGDATELRPTVMISVPAILDRIKDGVFKQVDAKGGPAKKVFNIAYKRCVRAIEGSWFGAWGIEQIIWDKVVFKPIRSIVGGHMRYMLCGGAPLSAETQRFINVCLGIPVGQVYGLTETFGGAALSEWDDTSVGRVGPPLPCCHLKLVSWEEGGYTISDTPMPRGEVVIGGPSVTKGYFNNDEKTREVYKVDENGVRWFYTGDIGQFHADGCLEIIDRKKDIVKLQHGEYISLAKVESALVASHYVDNIMVHADPSHSYCVALIVASHQALEKWAQNAGLQYSTFSELCKMDEAVKEVQQSLEKAAKSGKLDKSEVPAKVVLLPDAWTLESGFVTAALKLKREQIKTKFKPELQMLYH